MAHQAIPDPFHPTLLSVNQQKLFTRSVQRMQCPSLLIASSIHFIDFQALAETPPHWIGLIRHPASLVVSRFYRYRSKWASDVPPLFDRCFRKAMQVRETPGCSGLP
jgi:hypothetical protein